MFFINLLQTRALSKIVKERNIKFMSLEHIKTVCFVFDIGEEKVLETIKYLTGFLNDKKIDYIGLAINLSKNTFPDFVLDYQIKILTKNDVSFIGTPDIQLIDKIVDEKIDLYIDFASTYCYTQDFIARSSEATFKVGRLNYNNSPFDLVVGLNSMENSPMDYLKQVFHYLSTIKSA